MEGHPDELPDLWAKGFGYNGIFWAFDSLPSEARSAECLFHRRPRTPVLPQLERVLEYAFDVFWLYVLCQQHLLDAMHRINHE